MTAGSSTTSVAGAVSALPVSAPRPYSKSVRQRKIASAILTIVVPLALWFAPLGLQSTVQHALAVTAFMIVAWITHVMDHTLIGFLGCYLYWALGVAKFGTAFGGFAEDTPWFIFGGGLIGAMVTKSGLARRLAFLIMRPFGSRYPSLLLGLIVVNYLFGFVVPSVIARIVIMAAVTIGVIEAFGVGKGSNIGRAMFITLTLTSGVIDKTILSGAASITAYGMMQKFGAGSISYNHWFLAFFPCAPVTIIGLWRFALWLYPPEKNEMPGGSGVFQTQLDKMGKWNALEKRAALLSAVALGLWLTDAWHHLPPSMVGLGIGLTAALPGIGVLRVEDVKKLDLMPMFFVATVLSMGQVLVSTKTLDLLTGVIFQWLPHVLHGVYLSTAVLYWTAFVYHFVLASEISMLATSVPLIVKFALLQGINPVPLALVWTFAAGGKLFIYQSALTILGYSYGYFDARDVFRVGLFLTILEFVMLLLLVPLYWPLIGIR